MSRLIVGDGGATKLKVTSGQWLVDSYLIDTFSN